MLELDLTKRHNVADLENEVLEYWDSIQAFERSISERPSNKPFVFYDGPPFVTGSPHYGSLLGSIAKDVIPRYWTMRGFRIERQWGWDCHGLPIENMIEKDLKIKDGKRGIERLGVANFNNACRAAITEIDGTWEVIIRRIGRWVDFKNSYKTMDKNFMESVWWGFKELYEKKRIYEGNKVIMYCPRCATPLSNFEIAMDNSYVDVTEPSTTYKFEVAPNTYLLAWSTTPWTKLATMALAVHPTFNYVLVEQGGENYIVAHSRLEHLDADKPFEVKEEFSGTELVKRWPNFTSHFNHALSEEEHANAYKIVADEFVTAETGTGVVTLAVYGEDDYRVMRANKIPLLTVVDDEGRLTSNCEVADWVGMNILKASPLIDAYLQDKELIYKQEDHTHSVATCYRCGTRLYYAPLPAWFVDVQELKAQLLAENEKINWYPEHLKHGRFAKGIASAPDWNISRSRYWGTPMPVWKAKTGEQRVIGSLEELKEWAVKPEEVASLTDIHREFVDEIEVYVDDARTIKAKRIPEVFDCWVESSSMPFAAKHYPFENKQLFEDTYPAQFISEYINQTRAWFYTMHVLSVGLFGAPAYLNAHNSGIILASDGSKMSKSKKNYTDPMNLITTQGADALRLYLMASPVMKAESLAFSDRDVENMRKRVLNIWWNVFVFFGSYQPNGWDAQTPKPTHVMDRWILALLEETKATVSKGFDSYDVSLASRSVIEFIDQLSTWYLRQSRDRLREGGDLESWNTFAFVLKELALISAPVVPFQSELTYRNLPGAGESVHLELWPEALEEYKNTALLSEMASVRPVVEQTHAQRKAAQLKVRQPLSQVNVVTRDGKPSQEVLEVAQLELNIKNIIWNTDSQADLSVVLDTHITSELKEEGEARDLLRQIQDQRKALKVPLQGLVDVQLPSWPAQWEEFLKQRAKIRTLSVGEFAVSHTA
jgi:isoleucyl-tRNA synthetase